MSTKSLSDTPRHTPVQMSRDTLSTDQTFAGVRHTPVDIAQSYTNPPQPFSIADSLRKHVATPAERAFFSPADAREAAEGVVRILEPLPILNWHRVLEGAQLELLRRRAEDETRLRQLWAQAAHELGMAQRTLQLLVERRRVLEADAEQRLYEAREEARPLSLSASVARPEVER